MDKLLLIVGAVSYATTVTVSALECYTDSTCTSASNTDYCDRVVSKCTSCNVPCGPGGVVATCHRGCSGFCERLKLSGMNNPRFPKCWQKLPPATPPIFTPKPWPTAKGCLDNPSVCKRSQFCSKTSNSCRTCAKPCGERGNYKRCQNLCPKWCDHVLSRHRMVKYPFCRPITTAAPKSSTSPTSKPSTKEPTVAANSQTNDSVGGSYLNGEIANILPFLSDNNNKTRTTGPPKSPPQQDSGPIKVYVLSAVCGLVSIFCVVQCIVIVRRRKALKNRCYIVRTDVVKKETGCIPRQDMAHTSGGMAEPQAEAMLQLL